MEHSPILITGATRGLGLETARMLAQQGERLLLACRGERAGRAAKALILDGTDVEDSAIQVATLDVGELASVRRFCSLCGEQRLKAIVCNAGVQIVSELRRSPEGLEATFVTNHLGHFLLTRLLAPNLVVHGRVIFVASNTHDPARCTGMPAPDASDLGALADGSAFASERVASAGRRRYTTSKLCNVLSAYELQRRLGGAEGRALVFAFDPGLMPGTGLARDYGPLTRWAFRSVLPVLTLAPNVNTVRTSARRLADLATGRLVAEPGSYVSGGRPVRSSVASYDQELGLQLWELSSQLCGLAAELTGAPVRVEDARA
jgi:NAD(P)-dependent dehydrogenase (short-subunit alcohol dehydrogenase family)